MSQLSALFPPFFQDNAHLTHPTPSYSVSRRSFSGLRQEAKRAKGTKRRKGNSGHRRGGVRKASRRRWLRLVFKPRENVYRQKGKGRGRARVKA